LRKVCIEKTKATEDEGHDEEQEDIRSQRIPDRQQHRRDPNEAMAGGRERETDREGLAPIEPVHVVERDDATDHGGHPRGDVGDERCVGRESCLDQHPLAVVHD
jgi:hypothetical protein